MPCAWCGSRGFDVKLTLIGSGPLEKDLKQKVRWLKLDSHVVFLGALPSEKVMERMQAADLLVLPSVRCEDGQEEALGVTLLEAGALGLPVIGTETGGIPEIIEREKTGLLVPQRDPAALGDAIARLAGSPEERKAMGAAGHARVMEYFDLEKQTAKLENALLGILGGFIEP